MDPSASRALPPPPRRIPADQPESLPLLPAIHRARGDPVGAGSGSRLQRTGVLDRTEAGHLEVGEYSPPAWVRPAGKKRGPPVPGRLSAPAPPARSPPNERKVLAAARVPKRRGTGGPRRPRILSRAPGFVPSLPPHPKTMPPRVRPGAQDGRRTCTASSSMPATPQLLVWPVISLKGQPRRPALGEYPPFPIPNQVPWLR